MDRLSNILKQFNDLFGDIEWKDGDKIGQSHLGRTAGKSCPRTRHIRMP